MSQEEAQVPEYGWFVLRVEKDHPELARELAEFTGISSVLMWMKTHGLTKTSVAIIGQDEFHYDFLVEFGPGQWLAFGVT